MEVVESRPRRGRRPALLLFSAFVLVTGWLTLVPWPDTTGTRMAQGIVEAILLWFLLPLLAGVLIAWWTTEGIRFWKVLIICAGAGFLIGVSNLGLVTVRSSAAVNPGTNMTSLPLTVWRDFGLAAAALCTIGGAIFLGMARLVRGIARLVRGRR